MKNIIQRNLPLDVQYTLINKMYIPLSEGGGTICQNCGRIIAQIATVLDTKGRTSLIGFDCLETFLLNNALLDGKSIEEFEKAKKMINSIITQSKGLKKTFLEHPSITGLLFERQKYKSEYYTFYFLYNGSKTSRDNSYLKFKIMDFYFLIETMKNIFPYMDIIIKDL